MLNNDAMYDGRQTVYNKKKMLYFATLYTHCKLYSKTNSKGHKCWLFLPYPFQSFYLLSVLPFHLPKNLLLWWFQVQSALVPVTDHSLTRAIPLYDLPETLLKHQLWKNERAWCCFISTLSVGGIVITRTGGPQRTSHLRFVMAPWDLMPELDEIRNERAGIGKQHRCWGKR